MFKRSFVATMIAGLAAALGARPGPAFDTDFPTPSRTAQLGRSYRKTTYFPPDRRNGERECARRRRQMAHARQRRADLIARSLGARSFE